MSKKTKTPATAPKPKAKKEHRSYGAKTGNPVHEARVKDGNPLPVSEEASHE